ncbi:hypothetical protein ACFV2D_24945 [Streptomyces capillispiralis]
MRPAADGEGPASPAFLVAGLRGAHDDAAPAAGAVYGDEAAVTVRSPGED